MRFWAGVLGLGVAGLLVVPAQAAWAIEANAPLAAQAPVPAPAPAPAQKIPPKQWAQSVCTSLRDWATNIKDLTSEFRSTGGGSTDATQVKDLLVTYLGNTVNETDTLLTQLDQAGTPNFKDGSNYYSNLSDNFFTPNEFPPCGVNLTSTEIMGKSEANQ